ncbi:MAG: methyltransferase domain-containing protein [Thermoguttaceae bacterium]|nr:methyltransferase domain-containing protein [Thermoguttaceae bacterium]
MNSQEKWNPTKFIIKKNKLYSSPMIGYAERVLVQHIADFYTDAIPKYCKGILADVGCGTVPFYGFYKDYVDSVITIDWENTIHPNQYVDFFEDLNQGIHSVESNSVDSVICSDVLEHIYQPMNLLNSISDILKPGGILLLNVPFHFYIHEIPFDYYRYTNFALEKMLNDSGFEVLECHKFGGITDALALFAILGTYPFHLKPLGYLMYKFSRMIKSMPIIRKHIKRSEDIITTGFGIVARKKQ